MRLIATRQGKADKYDTLRCVRAATAARRPADLDMEHL
jgi:hypothetical protein